MYSRKFGRIDPKYSLNISRFYKTALTPHLCSGCIDKYWNDFMRMAPNRSIINDYKLEANADNDAVDVADTDAIDDADTDAVDDEAIKTDYVA